MEHQNSEDLRSVALVTGASSGLGQAMAVEFAARGIGVVAVGRSKSKLDETGKTLPPELYHPYAVDVSSEIQVKHLFHKLDKKGIFVKILINNAAVYEKADFIDVTPSKWMKTIEINLGGIVNFSHYALERMTHRGKGRIVNVGSFAGEAPLPTSSAYSVSKGAARILTKSICQDIADRFPDIIVTDWVPGVLDTQMGRSDGLDPSEVAVWGVNLALLDDRELTGATFERFTEVRAPKSLKKKIVDLVLGRDSRPLISLE